MKTLLKTQPTIRTTTTTLGDAQALAAFGQRFNQ
jgi:hypothetical protein